MEVAYLGPIGSFSYRAVKLAFPDAKLTPIATLVDVIEAYEEGRVDLALVPIENSIEGPVNLTIDQLFHQSSAHVVAEIVLPIVQNLLVVDVKRAPEKIFSHPQALAQTREYLSEHFPQASSVPVASTALAAEIVQQHPTLAYAAVANLDAADFYGLVPLAKGIQDVAQNNTRFWVLGEKQPHIALPSTAQKVTLALTLPENLPGALHKAISTFAWRGIDMTKIESRPLKTVLRQYFFIIDLVSNDNIKYACKEMESLGITVRKLGKYCIYEAEK